MGAAIVLMLVGFGAMAAGVLIGRYYVPDDRQLRRTARHSRAYMRALSHLIARDHDTVVSELRGVVEENVEDVEPYFALGAMFRSKGEHERAIRVHQALAVRERDKKKLRQRAMYELGLDFRAAGMPRRATRAMEEVLLEEPGHEGALRGLAGLYEEQARFNEAAGLWQRLGKRRNEDTSLREHHLLVAAAQSALGRDDADSAKQLLKAAQREHETAHFFAAAAELAAARGNHRGAKERLKQALIADPGLAPHLLPGLIAAETGLASGAKDAVDDLADDEPAQLPEGALEQLGEPETRQLGESATKQLGEAETRQLGSGEMETAMVVSPTGARSAIAAGELASAAPLGALLGETRTPPHNVALTASDSGTRTSPGVAASGGLPLTASDSGTRTPHSASLTASDSGTRTPHGVAASGGLPLTASDSGTRTSPGVAASGGRTPPHGVALTASDGGTRTPPGVSLAGGRTPPQGVPLVPAGDTRARTPPQGVPLVPPTRPPTTIADRVLAVLAEVEAETGPRLELALIRAQLVPPTDDRMAGELANGLVTRFPDSLAARVATARLALKGTDASKQRAALEVLVADHGALAWALRGRWQCANCGHRPGAFSWRCGQCRRWNTLQMETGIEPPPPLPRERRSAIRAQRPDGLLGAAPDESLPVATLDPGLSEDELARGGMRRSLLGRVGGWFSNAWRRDR